MLCYVTLKIFLEAKYQVKIHCSSNQNHNSLIKFTANIIIKPIIMIPVLTIYILLHYQKKQTINHVAKPVIAQTFQY